MTRRAELFGQFIPAEPIAPRHLVTRGGAGSGTTEASEKHITEEMIAAVALIELIIPRVPSRIENTVRAAIVIGHRRTDIDDLARACGIAPRTLHLRLASSPTMTARQLLAWALVLHATWRLERLEWNIKRTAAAAGFTTRDAFANYVRRNVSVRPALLASRGAVVLVCEQCVARLGGDRSLAAAKRAPVDLRVL